MRYYSFSSDYDDVSIFILNASVAWARNRFDAINVYFLNFKLRKVAPIVEICVLEREFEEIVVINIILDASATEQVDFVFNKIQGTALANVDFSIDFSYLIPETCLKVVNPEIWEVLFDLIFSTASTTAKNHNIFLIQYQRRMAFSSLNLIFLFQVFPLNIFAMKL